MAEIFISYRRGDDRAATVFQYLRRELFPSAVYQDVHAGNLDVFRRSIEAAVRDCRLVLVILGEVFHSRMRDLDKAVDDAKDENSRDVVRLELLTAISSGKPILPVVVTDRKPTDFVWPADLSSLNPSIRHYASIWPPGHCVEDIDRELPRLAELVKPYLTGYWQGRAADWQGRHRQASRAALAAGTAVALGVLALAGGGVWMWAADKRPAVVNVIRREPLPARIIPDVKTVAGVMAEYPPTGQQAPVAEYDAWKFDLWLEDYEKGLKDRPEFKDPGEAPARVLVLTADFDRDYDASLVRIGHATPGYPVTSVTGFLVSRSRDGPGPGRPVYRQLKTFREVSLDGQPGSHAVELTRPSNGERLLLVVVMKKGPQASWPADLKDLNFTLEKSS